MGADLRLPPASQPPTRLLRLADEAAAMASSGRASRSRQDWLIVWAVGGEGDVDGCSSEPGGCGGWLSDDQALR